MLERLCRVRSLSFLIHALAFRSHRSSILSTLHCLVFGGAGFNTEYPVEKLMRDSLIFKLYEGTVSLNLSIALVHYLSFDADPSFHIARSSTDADPEHDHQPIR